MKATLRWKKRLEENPPYWAYFADDEEGRIWKIESGEEDWELACELPADVEPDDEVSFELESA